MHQCYLDVMALVATHGRPEFFLTMTASPNWPEVQKNLRPGESAFNRPDPIDRAFHGRFRELLRMVTVGVDGKQALFGKVIAYTYVIEFQKRCLPHAHILLIMDRASKPKSAADID